MSKEKKIFLVLTLFLLILGAGNMHYMQFLQQKDNVIKEQNYNKQALAMRQSVERLTKQQETLTVLIAQALAANKSTANDLLHHDLNQHYFDSLVSKIAKDSLYKDLWIQVLNSDLTSIYRSWTSKTGDNLTHIRSDLVQVKKTHRKIASISVGRFTVSMKAMVPIIHNGKFIGIIEVISHFKPIVRQLQNSSILSLVLVNKNYTKQLHYAKNKHFFKGHFIAASNISEEGLESLEHENIIKKCKNTYQLQNHYILTCYPLKNIMHQPVGYFIMLQKSLYKDTVGLKYFTLKWIALNVIIFISLLLLLSLALYYFNRQQKRYYKKIIDLSNSVIIVTDQESVIETNAVCSRYFGDVTSLDTIDAIILTKHNHLQPNDKNSSWIDHIFRKINKNHKIKVTLNKKTHYFLLNVSALSQEEDLYLIVMTDITNEELYQQELQHISVTDPLTNIKNRYYFNQVIQKETQQAKRYEYPLSLIMFDIDFFKQINDTYGHVTGDKVLVAYTKLITSMLRKTDTFCRVGGEEFMIIAPHTDIKNAKVLAEKLRKSVEHYKQITDVTMSFGVVEYNAEETIATLLKRSDRALYKAKHNGRNRVEEG